MKPASSSSASIDRRHFIGLSSVLPAVLAAGTSGLHAFAADNTSAEPPKKRPIGLELYSVRGELMRSPFATLKAVAKIGYEAVEFYAPYFSWSPPMAKDIRSLMDDEGLRCYSTHNHFDSFKPGEANMGKAIELNQILGARHLILSSAPGGTKGIEDWKRLCGQLTTAVDQLNAHGLLAGFHNHQTEWAPLDGGVRVMDVIAANTPKEFVLQFDVGTCMEAGADPLAWIKANPGRIRSLHLKDWAPGDSKLEKGYRVLFGEGVTPWKEILAAAESVGGAEFYLMEQEGSRFSEYETAAKSLTTWKALRKAG